MGKTYDEITPQLAEWLSRQEMFFVATAPLSCDGMVNCSPKGMDTFRILAEREVAYLDLTGSGIETAAHIRENGRMVFMFCSFSGPPKIVRLHGMGQVVTPGSPEYERLAELYPDYPGARAVIRCDLRRISDSCGFSVPVYEYIGQRETLSKWANAKGPDGLRTYRRETNRRSLDGLPGLEPPAGTPTR
jgi:hypothetical protein